MVMINRDPRMFTDCDMVNEFIREYLQQKPTPEQVVEDYFRYCPTPHASRCAVESCAPQVVVGSWMRRRYEEHMEARTHSEDRGLW